LKKNCKNSSSNIKHLWGGLFTLFIFLLFVSLVIYIYNGTIDDFAPKHVGVAYLLTTSKEITGYAEFMMKQVPGYYAFIAVIMEITGINKYSLPVSPIIFIPYLLTFFAFVYIFLKQSRVGLILSLLLTFVWFTLPLTGSHKIWLWAHGVGEILFFTFIILIAKLYELPRLSYSVCCFLILGIIPFISYNVTYYLIALLFSLFFLLLIIDNSKLYVRKQIFYMFMFLIYHPTNMKMRTLRMLNLMKTLMNF